MKLNLLGEKNSSQTQKQKKSASGRKRSVRGSRLLTFGVFLGIAFAFWFLQRLQGEFVRTLSIPFDYDSVALKTALTGELPKAIELNVQDKGFEHLRYSLGDIEPIRLSVYKGERGREYIGIDKAGLQSELERRLSTSAVIVERSIKEIKVSISKRVTKRVPVRLTDEPSTGAGFTASSIRVQPDSVTIVGTDELLSGITFISLQKLEAEELKENLSTKIGLVLPRGVQSETASVRVDIQIEELTEQSFTLPIQVVGVPEGYILHPLPNTVNVLLTLPRSRYSDIIGRDVEVAIDYASAISVANEQGSEHQRQLPVKLSKSPKWVKRYSLNPEYVQFVLEKVE